MNPKCQITLHIYKLHITSLSELSISQVQNNPSSPQADLKLMSLPTQQKKANANKSQQRLEVRLYMM